MITNPATVEDHKELDRTSGSLFFILIRIFIGICRFGLNPFIALFIDRHFSPIPYLDLEWSGLADDS